MSIRTLAARAALFATLLAAPSVARGDAAPASPSPGKAPAGADAVVAAARGGPDTARVHIGPEKAGTDMFVAWPTGATVGPAIVVIQEWWGLNEQIREVAKRFARQGYLAVVPDLYHGKVAADAEGAHTLSRGLEDDDALADLDAAVAWIRAEPRAGKKPIGVVGFCMGGRLSQLLAMHNDQLSAAVMFYGRPVTDAEALGALRVPLQGHFGAEDGGIPVERVKQLEAALDEAKKKSEIYVYPGAGHAFMNDLRPSYSPDAARQAWARTLGFFQKHLKDAR